MRPLNAAELLSIWERGQSKLPYERALLLLSRANPETPVEALANQSIGERDRLLLTLREWTFGPQVPGLARCPNCQERLELTFNISDIRAEPTLAAPAVMRLVHAEYDIQFRLPNTHDLAAISETADGTTQYGLLLERCIVRIEDSGMERTAHELPPQVQNALVKEMEQADPHARILFELHCDVCHHEWQVSFDIVSFFWDEITAWARRMLQQVHLLASAYGWRESDILALTPWRRNTYLELIGA